MFSIYTVVDRKKRPIENGNTDQDTISRLCHDMNIERMEDGKSPCYSIGIVDKDGRISEVIPDEWMHAREYIVTDGDECHKYFGGHIYARREAEIYMSDYNMAHKIYKADDDDGPDHPFYIVEFKYFSNTALMIDKHGSRDINLDEDNA